MDIIQKLPDDIIVHIYTKILRKYRLHKGKFIKLIDFEKYKFLEKFIYRKMVDISSNDLTIEIKYDLNNFCQLPDRKDLSIDDDMMYVYLTFKENTVKYYMERFRLKKLKIWIEKDHQYITEVIMKIMIGKSILIPMNYKIS